MSSTQQDSSSPSGRRDFLKVAGFLAAVGNAPRPAQADTLDSRNRHKYEELFPEEFYEDDSVLHHLSADRRTRRARAAECAGCGSLDGVRDLSAPPCHTDQGIVYPIIPITQAGHPSWGREELRRRAADAAPPSCFVGREVCKSLYIERMASWRTIRKGPSLCTWWRTATRARSGSELRRSEFVDSATDVS